MLGEVAIRAFTGARFVAGDDPVGTLQISVGANRRSKRKKQSENGERNNRRVEELARAAGMGGRDCGKTVKK